MNRFFSYLKQFDWIMLSAVILLLCFSLAEIYSIALSKNTDLTNFKKQLIFVLIGLGLLFLLSYADYHRFRTNAVFWYILTIVLLLLVLIAGKTIRGTKGWFDFGFASFQPVEFAKIILIIFLAKFFSGQALHIKPFKSILISAGATTGFMGLVLLQPDFGSAAMLFAIWLLMVIYAGIGRKYIIILCVAMLITATLGWFVFLKDYQKQRILTFVNPAEYSLDEGYNVAQAVIAIGSGGITGRGIGFGSQSQLKFLPEAQTDFIFAVIAEELGFLGVTLVLSFFAVIFLRMLLILVKINNDFGIYFILGSLSLIFIQMFINIGMNIGIVPVVGISLPFLSYGGSSLLSFLAIIGIVQSIIIRTKLKY